MDRKHFNVERKTKMTRTGFCAFAALSLALAAHAEGDAAQEGIPPLLAAPALEDANGKAETGLRDPFGRGGAAADATGAADESGLLRTTMGEIPNDFHIVAISIPADTNTPRTALIQLTGSDEPILVHEGDLVRIDRTGGAGRIGGRRRASAVSRSLRDRQSRGAAVRAGVGKGLNANRATSQELASELDKYVFYLNVKNIEPTYIEVYHNKKRPDETIRLNW